MRNYHLETTSSRVTLSRDDLYRLEQLVHDPVPDRPDYFSIRTSLRNCDVKGESVDEFLQHEELPPVLFEVSFYLSSGWSEDARTIRLSCWRDRVSLVVEGADQAWVYGKFEVLKSFLKDRRPWPWASPSMLRWAFIPVAALFGGVVGASWGRNTGVVVAAGLAWAGTVTLSALATFGSAPFLSATRVHLAPRRGFPTSELILFFTVIAAIATIAQAIIQLVSLIRK